MHWTFLPVVENATKPWIRGVFDGILRGWTGFGAGARDTHPNAAVANPGVD